MAQNRQMVHVVEEACQMVLELDIPTKALAEVHIHKLALGVREA